MSYAILQQATDGLRVSNKAVTDHLIGASETAKQVQLDAMKALEALRANQTTLTPYIADTQAEQTAAEMAESNAQASQAAAQANQATAENQPALAQTELARAVTAANQAQLTALGATNDGLASVYDEHIRPSLVLDFAKGEYWKRGTYPWNKVTLDPAVDLTFTRASTATYFDANGVMQTAAIDAMRIDHDPYTGECLGVLIEPSRTNIMPLSNDFTQGPVRATYLQGAELTPNYADSPLGANTAWKIKGVGGSNRINAIIGDKVGDRTLSVFVKNIDAASVSLMSESYPGVRFDWIGGVPVVGYTTAGCTPHPVIPVGDGWFRISMTTPDTVGSEFIIGVLEGQSVLVSGWQYEKGPYPTSYIPTNGAAVTRSGEILSDFYIDNQVIHDGLTALVNFEQVEVYESFSIIKVENDIDTSIRSIMNFTSAGSFRAYSSDGYMPVPFGYDTGFKRVASATSKDTICVASKGVSSAYGPGTPKISSVTRMNFGNGKMYRMKLLALYPHALAAKDLERLTLPEATV